MDHYQLIQRDQLSSICSFLNHFNLIFYRVSSQETGSGVRLKKKTSKSVKVLHFVGKPNRSLKHH